MNPTSTEPEHRTFRVPYGPDNHRNPFGDYSHLKVVCWREAGNINAPTVMHWSLVPDESRVRIPEFLMTQAEAEECLKNFFFQQAAKTPEPDLLAIHAIHRWRLDCRKDTGEYRVMYWCESCGLWRCVEESGTYHATPQAAIAAAVEADEAGEPTKTV